MINHPVSKNFKSYTAFCDETHTATARHVAEKGNTSALQKFSVKPSSTLKRAQFFSSKRKYLEELRKIPASEGVVKTASHKGGRPLVLGKLNNDVQE